MQAVAGSAQYVTTTGYDALNRPIDVIWSPTPTQTAPSASSVTFEHGYDATNRRKGQTANDNSWWSYPTTASSTSYTANNLNQYTTVGSVSPTYDGNGNLTTGSFRYAAMRIDPESGDLYYARARMYNLTWGRLMQADKSQ